MPYKRASESNSKKFRILLHPVQAQFLDSKSLYRGFVGGRGSGKALALDTPIPTPEGWKNQGDLIPGDSVFDENGNVCRVVAVTDIMHGRPCCKVTFSDNSHIIADEEHEWMTINSQSRKNVARRKSHSIDKDKFDLCGYRILTTKEISKQIYRYPNKREVNYSIAACKPLKMQEQRLLIKPYTFGAWLGDGTAIHAQITSADQEILDHIRRDGYDVELLESQDRGEANVYSISTPGIRQMRCPNTGRMVSDDKNFRHMLRKLGVLDNKHIPIQYKRSSEQQRWELLFGLMDTDGSATEQGSLEFTSTNLTLAMDVLEVCISLGLKATLSEGVATLDGEVIGPKYRIYFTAHVPVFKLRRKLGRQHLEGRHSTRHFHRYITSVESVPSVPVRCIQVDSPNNLYLAGRSMIPTHNSFIGAYDLICRATAKKNRLFMVIAPTYGVLKDSSYRTFVTLADKLGVISDINRSDYRVFLNSGSQVVFRSAEFPDRLRGPNLSGAWFDEASYTNKLAYDIAIATLREAGELGSLTATFTPKGKKHWTYEVFGAGKKNSELFHCTTKDNPFLPADFEEILKSQYGNQMQAQELGGHFLDVEGVMFQRAWFVNNVIDLAAIPNNLRLVRYWDKACLVAGTMVETLHGPKPIETIQAGEFVLTRQGYKRVSWSGITKHVNCLTTVSFDDGRLITGTSDHPVWTENRGWVELSNLKQYDTPICLRDQTWRDRETRMPSSSFSTESTTVEDLERDTILPESGYQNSRNTKTSLCTVSSGDFITATFLQATKFITRTKTWIITKSLITNALQNPTMRECMGFLLEKIRQSSSKGNETQIGKKHGKMLNTKSTSASGAAACFAHEGLMRRQSFAVSCAAPGSEPKSKKRSAKSATPDSSADQDQSVALLCAQTSSGRLSANFADGCFVGTKVRKNFVQRVVEQNGVGVVPVYDLTVEDAHEFFANGILVHNSTEGGGCYTCGTLMGASVDGNFYVLDVYRGQWGSYERDQEILRTARQDFSKFGPMVRIFLEQEPGSSGVDSFKATARVLAGFPVFADKVTGEKRVRAEPFSAQCGAGNVRLVRNPIRDWIEDFLEELCLFPEIELADQVDSSSGAFNQLCKGSFTPPAVGGARGSGGGMGGVSPGSTTQGRNVNSGGLIGVPGGNGGMGLIGSGNQRGGLIGGNSGGGMGGFRPR